MPVCGCAVPLANGTYCSLPGNANGCRYLAAKLWPRQNNANWGKNGDFSP